MILVSPATIPVGSQSLYFAFTYTKKGEKVDLNSYNCDFIIDVNGDTYQKNTLNSQNVNIMVVGGVDQFIGAPTNMASVNYYITESQKITLYAILRAFAKANDGGTVDSNSEDLYLLVKSLYDNYRG